ncbi:MAG: hypothetical protein L3I99_06115 [Sulfurimonas sp.]|nr:hypothetical protein [Sulfurimonas sp.]
MRWVNPSSSSETLDEEIKRLRKENKLLKVTTGNSCLGKEENLYEFKLPFQ